MSASTAVRKEAAAMPPASRSFKGHLWQVPVFDRARIDRLIEAGVPPLLSPILDLRGVEPEHAQNFLRPMIREEMPSPFFFLDMRRAAEALADALRDGRRIAVWGDYDVDGATSSAILVRFLRGCGAEPRIYIPDRMTEGYGPNASGLELLAREGVALVCVLDSGTVAFEPFRAARAAGLEVVVIDHHAAEPELPEVAALVNPNRLDQEQGYGHVCAAGMTFLFCAAVRTVLRERNFFAESGLAEPDLMALMDLVALGTVADVVPLKGLNRAFVRRGLEIMTKREKPGIAALAAVCGKNGEPLAGDFAAHHCGFAFGPRINAGGRVGEADAGARLLSSDDMEECRTLAGRLDEWNAQRKDLERACLEEAHAQVAASNDATGVLFASGEGWHEGVVGIVASRMKDAYDRPSFVFSLHEGTAKGSGRSLPGFDLGAAVIAARQAGIVTKGGGHAMAAGVTLPVSSLPEFKTFLDARLSQSEFADTGVVSRVDMILPVERVSTGFVDGLSHLEPFGQGNPKPRFVLRGARVTAVDLLKEVHLRLTLEGARGTRLKALLFSAVGSPLGDRLTESKGETLDFLGTLSVNEWNGMRTPQMMIEDARPSTEATT